MSPRTPVPADGRRLPPHLDPRRGASRSPSGTRRAVVTARALAGLLSVVVLATSGWGWYLAKVAEAGINRTDAIPSTGNDGNGAAMNLLLVGSDSRANLTEEQLAQLSAGADSGLNTDTMILVHVPADGSKASFVSFPRDSYVEIPGHGRDKLNAVYAYGYGAMDDAASEADKQAAGAQLLVQTISELSGLRIDHYAEVDLLGFFELTSVVGGVEVNLCAPVDDREYSGAFFPAGPQTISGAEALAFVRQRHNLGPEGRGDYDRIVRQQVFLAGVLRNMLSQNVLLDLGKQRELVEAASRALTVDRDMDLFRLAQQMQSVTLDSITFQTVPYVGDERVEGAGSVVRLEDEETLHRFFAELSAVPEEPAEPAEPAEPPATVDPSTVSIVVLNGSGISGLAAGAEAELEAAGFPVTATGNADSSDYTRTLVRHAPGDEARAATVAAQIPGASTEVDDTLTSGRVQLVLGADFEGVGVPTAPQPPPGEVAGVDQRTADDQSCIR